MRHFFKTLRNRFAVDRAPKRFVAGHHDEPQVIVPDIVTLPLPKTTRDEISVPASINGRDLATGRL
jgi:hypothetical protein